MITTTLRWTLGVAAALVLQAAVLAAIFYVETVRYATAEVDRQLEAQCRALRDLPRADIAREIGEEAERDVHRINLAGLFDAQNRKLAGDIAAVPPELDRASGPVVVGLVRTQPPDPVPNSSRTIACTTVSGDRLLFARDMDALDALRLLVERALAAVTVPAIVIAGSLGFLLTKRGQLRFRLVESALSAVTNGDLQRRLPVGRSDDPFDRLARAVNLTLDRLAAALEDLRAFGDEIAHELRTPLTRLRAKLERVSQEEMPSETTHKLATEAIRDIDRALCIVSALLRIRALQQSERGTAFSRIALARLLEDAVDLYRPIAEERGVAIHLEIGPRPDAFADRDLLMEAICNLLDNAVKFSFAGGTVVCSLFVDAKQGTVIRIADMGPGIVRADLDAVLGRFNRGTQQPKHEGQGIGLSLVSAILSLHRFRLQIDDVDNGCSMSIIVGNQDDDRSASASQAVDVSSPCTQVASAEQSTALHATADPSLR